MLERKARLALQIAPHELAAISSSNGEMRQWLYAYLALALVVLDDRQALLQEHLRRAMDAQHVIMTTQARHHAGYHIRDCIAFAGSPRVESSSAYISDAIGQCRLQLQ